MNKDLTVGKPETVLRQFCLPLFGSIIFQQLYNIADSFVAGKFISDNALAAVGNSYEITLIFIAFAFGCNIGCSVIAAQLFGAKRYGDMKSAVYTALINLEHIKSYLPDSTFNRYGKVTALFAEEITEGPLAGKMALYADVEPTESLVELVKKGQKLFTSMEVSPKFADTGKAYLVGLAATDDPASLGTEMLTFSASAAHNPLANRKQNPANLFTAAEETVIELEEIQEDKPSLFARVTALFTKKEQSDDARFSDVHKAVELVATEQQNLSARTEKSLSEQEERLSELETALQAQLTAFNELVDKLSHEDSRQDYRQRATGGNAPADTLTNC